MGLTDWIQCWKQPTWNKIKRRNKWNVQWLLRQLQTIDQRFCATLALISAVCPDKMDKKASRSPSLNPKPKFQMAWSIIRATNVAIGCVHQQYDSFHSSVCSIKAKKKHSDSRLLGEPYFTESACWTFIQIMIK